MEQNNKQKNQKKGLTGNTMLIIIMSCWLLFYLFIGTQGGLG